MSTLETRLMVDLRELLMVRTPGWDAKANSLILQYATERMEGRERLTVSARSRSGTEHLVDVLGELFDKEVRYNNIKRVLGEP